MGFSITSAVIGGVVIICCSLSIEFFRWRKEYLLSRVEDPTLLDEKLENYDAEMVIIVIILVLGTVEFVIGIVTSICSCLMKPCTCCSCCETCLVHPQQVLCHPRQAIYGTFFPLYPSARKYQLVTLGKIPPKITTPSSPVTQAKTHWIKFQ